MESEENKTLYIKKNVSGELEENMQMDTIETSEWNILRTEDKSNWSERGKNRIYKYDKPRFIYQKSNFL